jgi:hypothetical protein
LEREIALNDIRRPPKKPESKDRAAPQSAADDGQAKAQPSTDSADSTAAKSAEGDTAEGDTDRPVEDKASSGQ